MYSQRFFLILQQINKNMRLGKLSSLIKRNVIGSTNPRPYYILANGKVKLAFVTQRNGM